MGSTQCDPLNIIHNTLYYTHPIISFSQVLGNPCTQFTATTSVKPHATQEVYPRGMNLAYLLGIPLGLHSYLLGYTLGCIPRGMVQPKRYGPKCVTQEVCHVFQEVWHVTQEVYPRGMPCNPRGMTCNPRGM